MKDIRDKEKQLSKIINKKSKEYTYFKKFGYQCFGPLLFAFSVWLRNSCEQKNIDKIFFLARDGYIMKEAFDTVNKDNVITKYFYASRRSIIVPSLWKLKDVYEIFDVIAFKKHIKLQAFLKKIRIRRL